MTAPRNICCALAISALALGCGGEVEKEPERPSVTQVCTEIGCANGVTVRVRSAPPEAATARACVDGRCSRWKLAERNRARVPTEPGVDASVRVSLYAADGSPLTSARTDARLTASRPNGPDCPPVCYSAGVVLDAERGRLRQFG